MIELEFIGAAADRDRLEAPPAHAARRRCCSTAASSRAAAASRTSRTATLPIDGGALDAVVLSHAHIDHSGALPLLCQNGFDGPVYATPATRDLVRADAAGRGDDPGGRRAHIASADRARRARTRAGRAALRRRRRGAGCWAQIVGLPYHRRTDHRAGRRLHVPRRRARARQRDRGARHRGRRAGRRASPSPAISGRHHLPILRDPEVPSGVDCLITESTYGDRLHGPIERDSATRWPRSFDRTARARRQDRHSLVRARARAGDRLRAQAPAPRRSASRRCRSTWIRR